MNTQSAAVQKSAIFMDDLYFMQSIFNGYCNCYSLHNWHKSSTFTDMTHNELHYFIQLGNMLGFLSRREPECMDLCWHEFSASKPGRLVMYLERENISGKVLSDTLGKLLSTQILQADYLIGVFGWITPEHHEEAVRMITKDINGRDLLSISFIGVDQYKTPDWKVEGNIWIGNRHYRRKAIAEPDKGGYWYIHFKVDSTEDDSKWEEL